MAEAKTRPTTQSLTDFLAGVADAQRRRDCEQVAKLMQDVTGQPAVMWGAIVGFGTYTYTYATGRTGDWPLTAFAPRKNDLTLYIGGGLDTFPDLAAKLGKYKHGKGCVYVKRLSDLDQGVLRELVTQSVAHMKATYPTSPA